MAVVLFSDFPGDPRPRRAAEAFRDVGMAVEVICLSDESGVKRENFNGIDVDRISVKHSRDSKLGYILHYCTFILIALGKLAGRSLTKRYHLVHIHNMPDILVFSALLPKCFGAKVMLDLHDPMPELMMTIFNVGKRSMAVRVMAVLERLSIAFANVVVTVNRACKKIFAARSCPPSKVCVVMNSPDEKIFRYTPAQIREKPHTAPFVVMYHGTLVDRNGVDLAVEAMIYLRQSIPTAELRIYGSRTPFLDQVLLSVAEKGLEQAVRYLGSKPLEQIVEAILESDVGVIPNKRSIFTELNTPTRIFEYLALGKPVVAPRAPGIQDYFDDDSLLLFELGNAEELGQRLKWVADHPAEALEVTRRGQAIYRSHSWKAEREKLVTAGAKLLNPSRTFHSEAE